MPTIAQEARRRDAGKTGALTLPWPLPYDATVGSVCAFATVSIAVGIMTGVAPAYAQTEAVVRRPPPPATSAGETADRPLTGTPMPWPKGGPVRVVWTGFQMNGEASRVYLQAPGDVEVSVATTKDGLTVTAHDCRLHVRNGRRPLDTRFFRTPVRSVSLSQRKKDVALLISLAQPVGDVVPHKEAGPNGSQFWVIDFPPAKAILADGARPPAR